MNNCRLSPDALSATVAALGLDCLRPIEFDKHGVHLILELKECDRDRLDNLAYVRDAMLEAARTAGGTIVGKSFHKFTPMGVTGVVAIAESHLCIHTWPEYGYAAVDIFTCGKAFAPRQAAQLLIERFHAQDPSFTELQRGVLPQLAGATLS